MSSNCVGAISQLVAQGHMNKYLNTNPNITFFRYQHMKHTNFAIENQRLEFEGGANHIGQGTVSSVRLHRSGDLVFSLYALIDLPGIANVSTELFGGSYQEIVMDNDEQGRYQALGGNAVSQGDDSFGSNQNNCAPYWTNAVGQYLCKEASVFIGSQPIDTLYNDYLFMYEELVGKPGRRLLEMIGKQTTRPMACHRSRFFRRLYVPLPFFFTKTSGNALPLVSLQFHDVRVRIAWNGVKTAICNGAGSGMTQTSFQRTISTTAGSLTLNYQTVLRPGQTSISDASTSTLKLWGTGAGMISSPGEAISDSAVKARIEAQYIYLDVMERAKFAEGSFEMLMDEVQQLPIRSGIKDATVDLDVNFNHAVIELLWATRQALNEQNCDYFNYAGVQEPFTGATCDAVREVDLRLNNQCRFEPTEGRYFRLVQPYQHHTNIPQTFVYSYSFALHPEDAQPSGSCNFSRIDNAKLRLSLDDQLFADRTAIGGQNLSNTGENKQVSNGNSVSIIVFARNWNILRVTLGLAGKAYAN